MILSELADNVVPCTLEYGNQRFKFSLALGNCSLDQQFSIAGLSGKLKEAIAHPNSRDAIKGLKEQLSKALVPVIASWDAYATPADEAADTPLEITAVNLQTLPGPILLAMSAALRRVTATDTDDDDGPEASGAD